MLVTSILSFLTVFSTVSRRKIITLPISDLSSANAFNMVTSKILAFGKGLTLSQTSPFFTCLQYKSFENIVGKGEIARNEQFLLFSQCFLPVWRTFCHSHQIENCRLSTLSLEECKMCRLGKS